MYLYNTIITSIQHGYLVCTQFVGLFFGVWKDLAVSIWNCLWNNIWTIGTWFVNLLPEKLKFFLVFIFKPIIWCSKKIIAIVTGFSKGTIMTCKAITFGVKMIIASLGY